jgi:hypothetical protein
MRVCPAALRFLTQSAYNLNNETPFHGKSALCVHGYVSIILVNKESLKQNHRGHLRVRVAFNKEWL